MKRKNLLAVLVLAVMLSLVLTVAVAADCPCPPPPPPPCAADCSPGFWKNHTELWFDDPQWADPVWMLAALRAKGNDEVYRPYRFEVADMLNVAYPDAPCDD